MENVTCQTTGEGDMARQRRSAAEARRLILDVAEVHLSRSGPGGLRLQEVAGDVGITHPGVLHHFKTREALVDAVVARAVGRLQIELTEALAGSGGTTEIMESVHRVLAGGGNARLLAWLIMAQPAPYGTEHNLEEIADAVQFQRNGEKQATTQTRYTILLASLALFADALAGPTMRRSLNLEHPNDGAAFRDWLGELISRQLR